MSGKKEISLSEVLDTAFSDQKGWKRQVAKVVVKQGLKKAGWDVKK